MCNRAPGEPVSSLLAAGFFALLLPRSANTRANDATTYAKRYLAELFAGLEASRAPAVLFRVLSCSVERLAGEIIVNYSV